MIKNTSDLALSDTLPGSCCFNHSPSSDQCRGSPCLWAWLSSSVEQEPFPSPPNSRLPWSLWIYSPPPSTETFLTQFQAGSISIHHLRACLCLLSARTAQQQSSQFSNLRNLEISKNPHKSYHTWMYIVDEKIPFYNIYKTVIIINVCLINTSGHKAIYSLLICYHSPCSDLIMQKGCSDAKR